MSEVFIRYCRDGHETWFLRDLQVLVRCGFCGEEIEREGR